MRTDVAVIATQTSNQLWGAPSQPQNCFQCAKWHEAQSALQARRTVCNGLQSAPTVADCHSDKLPHKFTNMACTRTEFKHAQISNELEWGLQCAT